MSIYAQRKGEQAELAGDDAKCLKTKEIGAKKDLTPAAAIWYPRTSGYLGTASPDLFEGLMGA